MQEMVCGRKRAMKLGYDRYKELYHWARQYRTLKREERQLIAAAIRQTLERRFEKGSAEGRAALNAAAVEMKKNICFGVGIQSIDLPYSERQIKRLRAEIFCRMDELKRKG